MSRVIPAFSQFFGSDGEPLANGWLRFLISGTNNTAKNTYADADQMIPNPNPLQLDGEGRCPNCFGQGIYRVVLFENNVVLHQPGELIQMFDPVVADYLPEGAGGNFAEWDSEVIYQIGQIVLFNEFYYRAVTANNIGNQPDLQTDDWERIEFLRFWNLDVTYKQNDVVIYGSQLFTSIMDANLNHNPASSPAWWYTVGPNQILYDTFVISEDQWRTSDAAGTSVILGADITLTADFSPISPVNINGYQVDGPFNLDFSNRQPSSLTENCFGPDLTVLGLEGEVFAEYWEAIGDGITVDTLAFQKAGATGLPVHLKSSKRYLIDGTVNGFAFISESHGNQLDNGTGNPESAFVLNAGAALTINKRGGYIRGICFYANADNIAMIHVTRKHVLIDHVKFFNNISLHTNVTGIRIGNTDAGETCPYFNLTNFVAFSMKYFLDFWGTSQCNAIHISNGGVTSYISGSSFIRYAATANCQRGAVKNVYVEHFTNILEVNAQYFNTNFLEINNDANDYFLYNTSATDAYQGTTNIDTQPAINWINPASTKGIYYSNYIKGPDAEFFPIGINALTRRGQTGGIKRATSHFNAKSLVFSDSPHTWDYNLFPTLRANATSGAIVVNLPSLIAYAASSMVASDWAGLRITLTKTDNTSNTVTLNAGSGFIGSNSTFVLYAQWDSVTLEFDGTNFYFVSFFEINKVVLVFSESEWRAADSNGKSSILCNNITLTSNFSPTQYFETNGFTINGAYTFAPTSDFKASYNCFGDTLLEDLSNSKYSGIVDVNFWNPAANPGTDDVAKIRRFLNASGNRMAVLGRNQTYRINDYCDMQPGTQLNLMGSTLNFSVGGATKRCLKTNSYCSVFNGKVKQIGLSSSGSGFYQIPILIGEIDGASGSGHENVNLFDLEVDQGVNKWAIVVSGDSHNIVIRNIYMPSNTTAKGVVLVHWGAQNGNPTTYGSNHGYNIEIENIRCPQTKITSDTDGDAAAIFLSGCYNTHVRNVDIGTCWRISRWQPGTPGSSQCLTSQATKIGQSVIFENMTSNDCALGIQALWNPGTGTTFDQDTGILYRNISLKGTVAGNCVTITSLRNVRIENSTFIGFGQGIVYADANYADGVVDRCSLKNVSVKSINYSGIKNTAQYSKNLLWENLNIDDVNKDGYTTPPSSASAIYNQSDKVIILNSKLAKSIGGNYYGIYHDTQAINCVTENVHIYNVASGGTAFYDPNLTQNNVWKNVTSDSLEKFSNGEALCFDITSAPFGALLKKILRAHTFSALSGALTTSGQIFPGRHFGVSSRVITAIGTTNGTTGYLIGTASDADLYGNITGTAVGTVSTNANFTAQPPFFYLANTDLRITAVGGNFDGTGAIRVFLAYEVISAPTM